MTSNDVQPSRIAIVGAGQAGLNAAHSLRRRGFNGTITLIGDEPYPPYQRPPLSKAYLKGELDEHRLFFRPAPFYADQRIDLRLETVASRIDVSGRRVILDDGGGVDFDRAIIATGARPIRLPIAGADLPGVLELRGLDDTKAIRTAIDDSRRIVVIGGGYIGLEVAAAARALGHEVTVLELLPRLLSRVTSPPVSDFYLALHRGHGVDIRLETPAEAILGDDAVAGVRLASGETIDADMVVVGVGVSPADDLAAAAGIDCDDGILVDPDGRTSDPNVFAAGDCTRHRLAGGDTLRLESVHNALDQSDRIAAAIVGDEAPPYDPPWFWSDQYDVKLQTVGLFHERDDVSIRGDVGAQRFSALYFRNDELVALDAVNDPVSFMAAKQILKKGIVVRRADLADPEASLKAYIKRAADRASAT